jgi:hypothetical protein
MQWREKLKRYMRLVLILDLAVRQGFADGEQIGGFEVAISQYQGVQIGEILEGRKQADTDIGISHVQLLNPLAGRQYLTYPLISNGCASKMQAVQCFQSCQVEQPFV